VADVSRDDGFTIADVDTGLYADPKVVALARRLRNPVQTAAHVALFEALLLGSWGAGQRITFEEALPAWWLKPADDVRTNLVAVGLIGDDGRIPERAWEAWFSPAWQRREARRENGRKGGRVKPRSSAPKATLKPVSSVAQPDRPSGRSVPSVPPEGSTRGGPLDVRAARPLAVVHPGTER
jgi:hypothetical protein